MASVSLNILPKYEYMVDACLATTHMYVQPKNFTINYS